MAYFKHTARLLSFLLLFATSYTHAQVTALPNAHAHNDYLHRHPLQDAMHEGFTSFEADIFLKKGEFILAHASPFLKHADLESLYLKPLSDSAAKNNNFIYSTYRHPIILLIDVKTNAAETYSALKPLLEKYAGILTSYENGVLMLRAVTIILSGNKPYEMVNNENRRLAFIDESLLNVRKNGIANDICPLASTKYSNILSWNGKGNIKKEEEEKLRSLVNTAHAQGKKVRLWASPENEKVWKLLLNCGVDLINTDELERLKNFLVNQN